ncbi:MAG: hypothetical protein MJ245_04470 [Clostridia bacterium]|nr:hypothetical protein [Clostridia bacterium]
MNKNVLKKIGIVCGALVLVEAVSTIILNLDEIKKGANKVKKGVSDFLENIDWDINDWP